MKVFGAILTFLLAGSFLFGKPVFASSEDSRPEGPRAEEDPRLESGASGVTYQESLQQFITNSKGGCTTCGAKGNIPEIPLNAHTAAAGDGAFPIGDATVPGRQTKQTH